MIDLAARFFLLARLSCGFMLMILGPLFLGSNQDAAFVGFVVYIFCVDFFHN